MPKYPVCTEYYEGVVQLRSAVTRLARWQPPMHLMDQARRVHGAGPGVPQSLYHHSGFCAVKILLIEHSNVSSKKTKWADCKSFDSAKHCICPDFQGRDNARLGALTNCHRSALPCYYRASLRAPHQSASQHPVGSVTDVWRELHGQQWG
jgi:hypothetical protein